MFSDFYPITEHELKGNVATATTDHNTSDKITVSVTLPLQGKVTKSVKYTDWDGNTLVLRVEAIVANEDWKIGSSVNDSKGFALGMPEVTYGSF